MPNQNIFCNTPWFEAHVYWDGSLGICCQERHRPYPDHQTQYNIRDMSLVEWCRSEPVQQFRASMLGNQPLSACTKCYQEETLGGISRRLQANLKSAIYTQQAFDVSWQQSPHSSRFVPATTQTPVDLHIDLGNFCNLTCKMCHAQASSRIAQQQVIWGNTDSQQFVGQDWTRDKKTWQRFLQDLLELPNLANLHFMGGETVLTPRFAELLDWLLAHGRNQVRISFVTNGTRWKPDVMERLSQFCNVGAEISIETVSKHNDYIRQGTDTSQVLANIQKYLDWANQTTHSVTLRSAPQALSAGSYHLLLHWALQHRVIIKANICLKPEFMHVSVLPRALRKRLMQPYQQILQELPHIDIDKDYNTSNPAAVEHSAKAQAQVMIGLLSSPEADNQPQLLQQLISHCRQWDSVGNLLFDDFYPELLTNE